MIIRPVGAELFLRTDGQKDMTKLIVVFRSLEKSSYKLWSSDPVHLPSCMNCFQPSSAGISYPLSTPHRAVGLFLLVSSRHLTDNEMQDVSNDVLSVSE